MRKYNINLSSWSNILNDELFLLADIVIDDVLASEILSNFEHRSRFIYVRGSCGY